jgi:ATP-dependent Clp protease ATP-binding subunit ClpX
LVKRFFVTREVVDHPAVELQRLLKEHEQHERVVMRELVNEFGRRFAETHGLQLRFTEAAADRLVALSLEQGVQVRELCAEKFKDYQFGLKLISTNTGQAEFVVEEDAVEAPDKVLSEWVVKSYRGKEGPSTVQVG